MPGAQVPDSRPLERVSRHAASASHLLGGRVPVALAKRFRIRVLEQPSASHTEREAGHQFCVGEDPLNSRNKVGARLFGINVGYQTNRRWGQYRKSPTTFRRRVPKKKTVLK